MHVPVRSDAVFELIQNHYRLNNLTILGGGGLLVFIRGFYMGFSPFWPYQVRPQWGNHALLTINLNDLRKQENNRRGVQSAIDVG